MVQGTLAFRIKPRASRNSIRLDENGTVTVAVTAPPVDNKANSECVAFLAKLLRCRKTSLQIIKGEHARDKVIACVDLSTEEITERLKAHIR